jgi:molybdenum cofactor cytidylyltransferase
MTTEGARSTALEALVLAAGAGLRFGGGKLTAPWEGGVLLDGALGAAFAAPVRSVVVVYGEDRRVAAAASDFAARTGQGARLRLVQAERSAEGLSRSLEAGVAALPSDCAGAFVFLGDMPRIPNAVLGPLADALAGGAKAAAPKVAGRRGHPVLFSSDLFAGLMGLQGDRGAATLLDGLGDRLVLIETDDAGALFDVDRPEDIAG